VIGLAHGAAGVIAFLSAAARLDAGWRARIRPIVERHAIGSCGGGYR
jgi:hypothetical protein